jgi:hypothetical protein
MLHFPKLTMLNAAMIAGILASSMASDHMLRLAASVILP